MLSCETVQFVRSATSLTRYNGKTNETSPASAAAAVLSAKVVVLSATLTGATGVSLATKGTPHWAHVVVAKLKQRQ